MGHQDQPTDAKISRPSKANLPTNRPTRSTKQPLTSKGHSNERPPTQRYTENKHRQTNKLTKGQTGVQAKNQSNRQETSKQRINPSKQADKQASKQASRIRALYKQRVYREARFAHQTLVEVATTSICSETQRQMRKTIKCGPLCKRTPGAINTSTET